MLKELYSLALFVFTFFLSTNLHSQQKISLEALIPPAPNAAELGKYGAIPVGTLSGIPEISFPLYEINTGKLKLPITLSYHASGIKVNQISTDLGLGWSINAGGQISRTVYGTADDKPNGYFNYTPPSLYYLYSITDYYQLREYSLNPSYDLEPDLFVYNVGGKSGKFICRKDKSFMTIPFEPIKIQKGLDGQFKVIFQITDDNGTVYQFNNYTTTVTDQTYPPKIWTTLSSWYLTTMISADLSDTIKFEYDNQGIEDATIQHSWEVGATSIQSFTNSINYNELLLKKITFRNGYIQFNRATLRKDTHLQSFSLDEMLIYNEHNFLVKKVSFGHDYFYSSPFYDAWDYYRLKLTGFTESSGDLAFKKEYKFDYNTTAFPPKNSFNIDYWGFYNGQSNQSLIPLTTVYGRELNRSSFADGATYTNNYNDLFAYTVGNANREPSAFYMQSGILSKISYPTGGYTLFEFEPHQYLSDEYIQQSVIKGGKTIGISKFTKSEAIYNFTYPSNTNYSSLNSESVGNLYISFSTTNIGNTIIEESQVVTLTDLTSNTVQTWKHDGDITIAQIKSLNQQLLLGHSYQLKVTVYGDNSVFIDCSLTWTENTDQHPTKIGGGLRVKSIKSFSNDNVLTKEENYAYGNNESGIGTRLFDERSFYRNYEDFVLEYFGAGSSSGYCIETGEVLQRKYLGISNYSSLNYLGSPVLYPSVTKYEGNASSNIGKTAYQYNINLDQINPPSEFINSGNYGAINNAWNQGELLSETYYNNVGGQYTPVTQNSYEYTAYNQITENAILIKEYKQVVKTDGCTMATPPGSSTEGPGLKHFSLFEYHIKTGASRRTKETRIVYSQQSGGSNVSSIITTQFQNTSHLYPTEVAATGSDGNIKITRFKYPLDLSDAVSTAMVAKNVINPTLEEKSFKSVGGAETLLSTKQTVYRQIGNLIEPDTVKLSTGTNIPEPRIRFNQYDLYGNIVEQQKTNDVKEVYLWGYNSVYPVAKILNTTYEIAKTYISQSILNKPSDDATLRAHLNNLRNISGALVAIYTYKPLVGMTSKQILMDKLHTLSMTALAVCCTSGMIRTTF